MIFPTIQAENLEGRALTLPTDLEGAYNVLFIAFQRDQQADIDSWIPAVKRLMEAYPGLAYYELPTIYRGNSLFRWWVNTGMRMGIPDKKAREVTITLYLEKQAFRQALNIPNEERIYVLLVNRKGEVLWRTEGPFEEEKGQDLQRMLESQQNSRAS
ncbi:MAG TPA: hypothetical protein VFA10_19040 [Ktedonobacteraceae bacterium]|nr:hypothetical protein [Ktedonobacteraceae bacterium]